MKVKKEGSVLFMNTKTAQIKQYVGNKYTFCRNMMEKEIGKGGNGTVYNVRCDALGGEYVIKLLTGSNNNEERIKRFRREISTMDKITKDYPNEYILPLVDFKFTDAEKWYVTPKAICLKDYLMNNHLTFEEKYKLCLNLCSSLCELHSLKYYHRDIKLANIFIQNGKILLGDFGLVWNEEYVDLTITREGIGPYDTKPPECYIGFAYNIPDELQYAIDIYEFIKTMWMVLKNTQYCFHGSYVCGARNISLNLDDVNKNSNIKTLGPLHELLEIGTLVDASLRPKMEDVYLRMEQLFEVNRDEKQIKEWELKVLTKKFINKNRAEIQGYYSINEIVEFINNVKGMTYIVIKDFEKIFIDECTIADKRKNIMLIVDKNKNYYVLSAKALYINQSDIQSNYVELEIKQYNFLEDINYYGYKSIYQYDNLPGVIIENEKMYLDKEDTLRIVMS